METRLPWAYTPRSFVAVRLDLVLRTVLAASLLAAAGVGLTVGAIYIPIGQVVDILLSTVTGTHDPTDTATLILLQIRAPRLLLGLMVGAALAVSGVLMQGIFRNGLADPTLIGVSSGASLGAATMIVAKNAVVGGTVSGPWLVAVAAFIGGMVAAAIVYRLSLRRSESLITTMLLAGIAINALAQAGVGLLVSVASDEELRDLTFWTLGSISGATWTSVTVVMPFVVILIGAAPWLAASLDGLLLGEAEAAHIGISVERVKRAAVVLAAAAVGASVAVCGLIFFVGLVVPHLVRLSVGPGHGRLFPAAAALGAVLLVFSDVVARTVVAPAELPIGIITAFLGAPFFLVLLTRVNKGS